MITHPFSSSFLTLSQQLYTELGQSILNKLLVELRKSVPSPPEQQTFTKVKIWKFLKRRERESEEKTKVLSSANHHFTALARTRITKPKFIKALEKKIHNRNKVHAYTVQKKAVRMTESEREVQNTIRKFTQFLEVVQNVWSEK